MVFLTEAGLPDLLLRLVFLMIFKTCHAIITFLGTFCLYVAEYFTQPGKYNSLFKSMIDSVK